MKNILSRYMATIRISTAHLLLCVAALVTPHKTIQGKRLGWAILDYFDEDTDYSDILTPEQNARLQRRKKTK